MTNEEMVEYHSDMWKRLPDTLKIKSVLGLRNILDKENPKAIEWFRDHILQNPTDWWAKDMYHFRGGMVVRNLLRSGVGILDDELPSGNWDDYYIMVIEQAVKMDSNTSAGSDYNDWENF